ncbi:MAG TPA: preprotein translocase subunit SecG [Gammaproteobacteria bacterium]|nr:preprotein translocase subunit SecG [Gammaproteobacteria bacterium]
MLFSILIAVMVVLGIVLIALILVQQGKGADAGAAFGSGASGTVFGSRGSATFLSRATGVLMALFMALAIVMVYIGHRAPAQTGSVMASAPAAAATFAPPAKAASAPVAPAATAGAKARSAAPAGSAPNPATGAGRA